MSGVIEITESEIRGAFASQEATRSALDKLGWSELLGCLAVAAETEARFCSDEKIQRKWRKLSKRLSKTASRIVAERWPSFAIDFEWQRKKAVKP